MAALCRDAATDRRFHGFLTAHWDHEPLRGRSADLLIGPLRFGAGSRPIGRSALHFHGFETARRKDEPTPDPSKEGNCHRTSAVLLPSWEGSGVGRSWFAGVRSFFLPRLLW